MNTPTRSTSRMKVVDMSPFTHLDVGDIVHYVEGMNDIRAAMVVHVWNKVDGVVNLVRFGNGTTQDENGCTWETSVPYADPAEEAPGTWHWP